MSRCVSDGGGFTGPPPFGVMGAEEGFMITVPRSLLYAAKDCWRSNGRKGRLHDYSPSFLAICSEGLSEKLHSRMRRDGNQIL